MSQPAVSFYAYQGLKLGVDTQTWRSSCNNDVIVTATTRNTITRALRIYRPANINTRPWSVNGWRPPTNWAREYCYIRSSSQNYRYSIVWHCGGVPSGTKTNDITTQMNNPVVPTLTTWPYSVVLRQRNTNDVLLKLKDESCNLSLAFAERKQTESLLTSTMDRIGDSVRAFKAARKGRWKELKRIYLERERLSSGGRRMTQREMQLLRIPNAWLEVQYGWNPLMSDVYGAMQAVDKKQRDLAYLLRCSKNSKQNVPYSYSVSGDWSVNVNSSGTGTRLEACNTVLYYTLNTNELTTLASLGLTNPVNLAWELVPFSFVVDWFLPLGDWFNSFDATLGKTFKSGTRTQVMSCPKISLNTAVTGPLPGPGYSVYETSKGSFEFFRMHRDVLSAFPSPHPPAFKNPCSPSHVASALSLMASAFGRSVRPYVRS